MLGFGVDGAGVQSLGNKVYSIFELRVYSRVVEG